MLRMQPSIMLARRALTGTLNKGSSMNHETELATVREQVSMLTEQVFCLVEVISRQTSAGSDTAAVHRKLDILENLMSKLYARQTRLKNLLH